MSESISQFVSRVDASTASLSSLSVLVLALSGYHVYLRNTDVAEKYVKTSAVPAEASWLDQQSYEVFAALCDAIVPSYGPQECTVERVLHALRRLHPQLHTVDALQYLLDVDKYAAFLSQGALQRGVDKHCARALQRATTKSEKRSLFFLLKLLSTSVGTLLLTGYPVPFQKLPLYARENVLRGFRDSSFESKRQIFLTFKRLVASTFLSLTDEHTNTSPLWSAIEYSPRTAMRSLDSLLDSTEHPTLTLFRSKVNYRAVVRELAGTISTHNSSDKQSEPDEVEVDVVIVGSGCGGSVVAHQLVAVGYTVLVLEKGGFFQSEDFARWNELEALSHMYERGGLCTTADGNVTVLAGSCLGGGSTVNWSASFDPPRHVLEQWSDLGLSQFDPDYGDIVDSLKVVNELFHINKNHSYYEEKGSDPEKNQFAMNENNRLLWKGANALGYIPEKIARNVKNCVDCGHCTYGCSHESKQSTWTALLEPILLAQIKEESSAEYSPSKRKSGRLYIIPDCNVDTVTFSDSERTKATGVLATAEIYAEHVPAQRLHKQLIATRKLVVSAKVVVSSAGAIHTPALLLRSKLTHPLIGKNLCLHPVLGCGGIVDKNTGLASGVSMGVVVKHPTICANSCFSDRERYDAETHPVIIETPPVHMSTLGLLVPWDDGLVLKSAALGWRRFGAFIDICRDHARVENRVEVDEQGAPVLHYALAEEDEANLLAGLEVALRLMRGAGAKALFYSHTRAPWFVCKQSEKESDKQAENEEFEEFLCRMRREGVRPLAMQVFSAHQLSSCRMASYSSLGPVSPSGALFDCGNLFVADGSAVPSAVGVNPMVTINAVAHLVSKHIAQYLQHA